jgi:hypothetical protein
MSAGSSAPPRPVAAAPVSAKDAAQRAKIFVGGLPTGLTSEQLRAAFVRFGGIKESQVLANRDTGRSRGFGFIVFADPASVKRAMDAGTVDPATQQVFHKIGTKQVEVKRAASRDEMRGGGGAKPAAPAPEPSLPTPPAAPPGRLAAAAAAPQSRAVANGGLWSHALPAAVTRAAGEPVAPQAPSPGAAAGQAAARLAAASLASALFPALPHGSGTGKVMSPAAFPRAAGSKIGVVCVDDNKNDEDLLSAFSSSSLGLSSSLNVDALRRLRTSSFASDFTASEAGASVDTHTDSASLHYARSREDSLSFGLPTSLDAAGTPDAASGGALRLALPAPPAAGVLSWDAVQATLSTSARQAVQASTQTTQLNQVLLNLIVQQQQMLLQTQQQQQQQHLAARARPDVAEPTVAELSSMVAQLQMHIQMKGSAAPPQFSSRTTPYEQHPGSPSSSLRGAGFPLTAPEQWPDYAPALPASAPVLNFDAGGGGGPMSWAPPPSSAGRPHGAPPGL